MSPDDISSKALLEGATLICSAIRQTRRDSWEETWSFEDSNEEIAADDVREALAGCLGTKRLVMHAKLGRGGAMYIHSYSFGKPN